MKSPLVPVRYLLLILSLAISPEIASADVPEPLQQRQQQLFGALQKVRGAVVGVSDGMGVGSGVVISRDGIVLTASHVVDSVRGPRRVRRGPPERGVTITFPDGREYAASVLGKNRDADAAVLKIDDAPPTNAGFPFAEMGRITETKIGQWCFAMGHPGGYRPDREAPVRIGRVLSIGNRTVVSDCAILLGDSGGPLFNMDGKVIGIHSMITSLIIENRHVSIDCYHDDWDRLLAGDRWGRLRSSDNDLVSSAFFGVHLKWKDFVPEVTKVLTNSPAEKAGLQRGDVLLAIEGEPIADRLDLGTTLDLLEEDQSVKLKILRGDSENIVSLVTGDDSDPDVDDEDGAPNGDAEVVMHDDEERENEIMEQLSENRRIGKFEKRTADELKLYSLAANASNQSIVSIRDGGLLLCLGTVMSSDGYILTKASEMDGAIEPEVILPGGRRYPAKELAADRSFDLMLLKVDATDLKPAAFRTDAATVGQLSVIQDAKGNALIPTVISVAAHTMEGAKKAFLGVMPVPDNNGVRIGRVIPGGAADRNGIKENDIVMSVAGSDVHSPEELVNRIGAYKPGDKIALRYMREDKIRTIEIVLTSRFTNENPLLPLYNSPEFMGQFASTHSGGFPRALQIDADVYPTKVGGPLLDLEGKALGIVIARADRYPTYAIPSDAVLTVFEQLKAESANTAPAGK
jgi:serine protease Do